MNIPLLKVFKKVPPISTEMYFSRIHENTFQSNIGFFFIHQNAFQQSNKCSSAEIAHQLPFQPTFLRSFLNWITVIYFNRHTIWSFCSSAEIHHGDPIQQTYNLGILFLCWNGKWWFWQKKIIIFLNYFTLDENNIALLPVLY